MTPFSFHGVGGGGGYSGGGGNASGDCIVGGDATANTAAMPTTPISATPSKTLSWRLHQVELLLPCRLQDRGSHNGPLTASCGIWWRGEELARLDASHAATTWMCGEELDPARSADSPTFRTSPNSTSVPISPVSPTSTVRGAGSFTRLLWGGGRQTAILDEALDSLDVLRNTSLRVLIYSGSMPDCDSVSVRRMDAPVSGEPGLEVCGGAVRIRSSFSKTTPSLCPPTPSVARCRLLGVFEVPVSPLTDQMESGKQVVLHSESLDASRISPPDLGPRIGAVCRMRASWVGERLRWGGLSCDLRTPCRPGRSPVRRLVRSNSAPPAKRSASRRRRTLSALSQRADAAGGSTGGGFDSMDPFSEAFGGADGPNFTVRRRTGVQWEDLSAERGTEEEDEHVMDAATEDAKDDGTENKTRREEKDSQEEQAEDQDQEEQTDAQAPADQQETQAQEEAFEQDCHPAGHALSAALARVEAATQMRLEKEERATQLLQQHWLEHTGRRPGCSRRRLPFRPPPPPTATASPRHSSTQTSARTDDTQVDDLAAASQFSATTQLPGSPASWTGPSPSPLQRPRETASLRLFVADHAPCGGGGGTVAGTAWQPETGEHQQKQQRRRPSSDRTATARSCGLIPGRVSTSTSNSVTRDRQNVGNGRVASSTMSQRPPSPRAPVETGSALDILLRQNRGAGQQLEAQARLMALASMPLAPGGSRQTGFAVS
eukprot:TRINITY_DN67255_c0_g1_i1.p1 TRINITY_DN67255_c0_g1~~TRINITY_DN67255_c0_g1_i1.p1  ORF type:complete len:718 (-),score=126.67 TRINITY_DN67255_c0_g1_i1:39-2192(-)